jgi:ribosomal-protein-alanine N-acetyltransferase
VAREYQRRGVAQCVIGELEKAGRERGCGYAYLEVRVSNRPAIELYKKLGYQSAYTRKGYYLDGEDALVMEKVL